MPAHSELQLDRRTFLGRAGAGAGALGTAALFTQDAVTFARDGLCSSLREYWFFSEGRLAPPPGWGL